jgi:hypothetical protein
MPKILHNKSNSNYIVKHDDIFNSVNLCVSAGNNGCSVIIPHVCNNINGFGAGFAGAVAKNYPIVKENFHLLGNKAVLGHVQFVVAKKDNTHKHKIVFANMIAQNGTISKTNIRPLNYYALARCMANVALFINQNFDKDNRVQIHAPKFGSGLAGGNWNFIKELVDDLWSNIPVFIYQHK